jgi:hypothetical protein
MSKVSFGEVHINVNKGGDWDGEGGGGAWEGRGGRQGREEWGKGVRVGERHIGWAKRGREETDPRSSKKYSGFRSQDSEWATTNFANGANGQPGDFHTEGTEYTEKIRQEGLEEIARLYLLQPVGGGGLWVGRDDGACTEMSKDSSPLKG